MSATTTHYDTPKHSRRHSYQSDFGQSRMIKEIVGEGSRQRVIQSAQKTLVNEGFGVVTHRAVADDAGVPLESAKHHLKDKL